MIGRLSLPATERLLVGPERSDDAGVYRLDGRALVVTADLITPVCDDPVRFGRVVAANALSDVWAMGGEPLLALNLCCFPERLPDEIAAQILQGAADQLAACGAVLVGGHSVLDDELKYGLAVVGYADPERLLTLDGATPGDRLILTKPLGTGVLINAFKFDKISAEELDPALREMERLNADAARLALEFGASAATDVTGFGLAGHAGNLARGSGVGLRIHFDSLPVHRGFFELADKGVTTGCTAGNAESARPLLQIEANLGPAQRELLVDPQTSGGLLLSVPRERAEGLLQALHASGHQATAIGEVIPGSPRIVVA